MFSGESCCNQISIPLTYDGTTVGLKDEHLFILAWGEGSINQTAKTTMLRDVGYEFPGKNVTGTDIRNYLIQVSSNQDKDIQRIYINQHGWLNQHDSISWYKWGHTNAINDDKES